MIIYEKNVVPIIINYFDYMLYGRSTPAYYRAWITFTTSSLNLILKNVEENENSPIVRAPVKKSLGKFHVKTQIILLRFKSLQFIIYNLVNDAYVF